MPREFRHLDTYGQVSSEDGICSDGSPQPVRDVRIAVLALANLGGFVSK